MNVHAKSKSVSNPQIDPADFAAELDKLHNQVEFYREMYESFKAIADDAPDLIVRFDRKLRYAYINNFATHSTGLLPEAVIGKTYRELGFPEELCIHWDHHLQYVLETGLSHQFEYSFSGIEGLRYYYANAKPEFDNAGQVVSVLVVTRDITLKKLANEELFKKAFNANPHFMIISTFADGTFLHVNEGFIRVTGYSYEETIGKTSTRLGLWNAEQRDRIIRMLQNQAMVHNVEVLLRKKSGEFFFGLMSAESFEYKDKQCLIISVTDITELKETIRALCSSEERFAKMFNASPIPMTISTLDTMQVIDVNDSFLEQYGDTRAAIVDKPVCRERWKDPRQLDKTHGLLLKQGCVCNEEVEFFDARGDIRIGLYSAEVIELIGTQCVLSVINDVTKKRRLEKELGRLSQMHLIGQMAANIGHEIRNPMTTVRGYLQLLGAKPELTPYHRQFSTMIEEIDRANSIIGEFLALAKDKTAQLRQHDINAIIQSLAPLVCADAITNNHNVLFELGEIPALLVDEKEIRQLLLNLVRNGLEAMDRDGNLIIKTYQENNSVILAVIDEGSGIASHVIDKLGTPFFTTKENGTGLGLPVCYSIANRHNAAIKVDSSPSGTIFSVVFRTGTL